MLSSTSLQEIDRAVAKYPSDQKQSAVMAALAIAQRDKGWLSNDLMEYIAQYLSMPPVAVYEVASFYSMYNLSPVGQFKLSICTNLPCALQGANHTAEALKNKLGIGFNQTTKDGCFTLKEAECMGSCGDAPVVIINDRKMVPSIKPENVDAFLQTLTAEKNDKGAL
ncbi:MAG: NADH-quinone oxidoreductase subunit NuoE [Pseudomonadota bacterium]